MENPKYGNPDRIQFNDEDGQYGIETLSVRAGQHRSDEGEHSSAMYLTSSYVFSCAEEAAARFSGEDKGNIYSRFTNPTVMAFERRIAALEGGERAIATSSGMAAIASTCLALLQQGDHVVCSQSVFGSTISLFNKYLSKTGISVTYVDPKDPAVWEAAIEPSTKMFFMETPSNPLAEITDVRAISDIAHQRDILVVVDNCFCTPALQQPLKQGADIIIHSATKYLDGQGRCIGGVVVGTDAHMEELYGYVRTCGTSMSPFNAWVFLGGLETLKLRMDAHSANALEMARWLEQHPNVEKVYYAGLESHPQHELAAKQQSAFGGVLAFEVKGGKAGAFSVINATKMISITGNLGDVKTTITNPATTTHGRMTPEEREIAGLSDGLIRLSVGLETVDDIKADLLLGLDAL
ncbi:MAG: O-succinylhomoserine sulfhydrylase [Pontibacterium sp.]